MQKHTKIYLEYFGYSKLDAEYIPCEVCDAPAVDIHHIENRGMGGSKTKDHIGNLQALCRKCHVEYGDKTEHKDFLVEKHLDRLMSLCNDNLNNELKQEIGYIMYQSPDQLIGIDKHIKALGK